jgi:hypothetical protein
MSKYFFIKTNWNKITIWCLFLYFHSKRYPFQIGELIKKDVTFNLTSEINVFFVFAFLNVWLQTEVLFIILFQFVFAHIVWFLSYSSQIMHIIRRLIWYTVYPSFVGFSGCVLMPYNIFQKYLLEHLYIRSVF